MDDIKRTIENKIKAYDAIIISWGKMRNQIYNPQISSKWIILNTIYHDSQTYVGQVFLVCEDTALANDINVYNELYYRQPWDALNSELTDETITELKSKSITLVERMRKDIQSSSVLNKNDFFHIWKGLIN